MQSTTVLREVFTGKRKLVQTLRAAIRRISSRPPRSAHCGKNVRIERPAEITLPRFVTIGDNTKIGHNCYIAPTPTHYGQTFNPDISIGNNVYIGPFFFLVAIGRVSIGDDCVLSNHVYISDAIHGVDPDAGNIMMQPLTSKGQIEIGRGCFIGYRCAIMPGVSLGEYCVVGIGSVVTRSFPPYSMVAGSPARLIKVYSHAEKSWVVPDAK